MPPLERVYDGFLPGRHAIDAYGQGGFRFGGMSHKGSLLALPSGIRKWEVADPAAMTSADFSEAAMEAEAIDILIIGTGSLTIQLPPVLRKWFAEQGLRPDVMTTSAAAMTYNVLLAENRRVAAALIAVD